MNGVEHAGADRQPGPGDSPAGAPAEQSLQELAKGDYRARDDLPDMPGYGLRCAIDQAHRGQAVTAVRFSPDGRSLASAGSDGTAAIWDTASGQLLQRLEAHKRGISDIAWSPDGRYVATASDDFTLRVWDAASGHCLRLLDAHNHFAFCCAWSAGGNLLVSGGFDEVVIVWDVRHGQPIKTIPGHSDPVSGVHFNGDPTTEELIASCSFDGLARVWSSSTGRCMASLADRQNPALASLRFSPNGKYLLTVTMDSRLLLWEHTSRKIKKIYGGHLNRHSCLQATFVAHHANPQQRYVACGSEDCHVYLWHLQSKQIAGVLRGRPSKDAPGAGHCATVLAVDATQPAADPAVQAPQLIASGGHMGDGSIRIWELGGAAPMDAA